MAFMTDRGWQRGLMQRQLSSNDFVGRLDTTDKTRYAFLKQWGLESLMILPYGTYIVCNLLVRRLW